MKYFAHVPPFNYNESHIKAWSAILECEGKRLELPAQTPENNKKCMVLGKGVGLPVLLCEHNGKETFIGCHYSDLVKYLNNEGLMQC